MNIEQIKKFIEYLPEDKPNLSWGIIVLYRGKYAENPIKSKISLDKKICKNKKLLLDTILHMGSSRYYYEGELIDESCTAVYLYPNQLNNKQVAYLTISDCADMLRLGNDCDFYNKVLSNYYKSPKRTFSHFDIDSDMPTEELIMIVKDAVGNDYKPIIVKTKNGFHVLIDSTKLDNEHRRTFYKKMMKISDENIAGNNPIPVPGTNQGGFVPYLIIDP